ncbi:UDP-2,3-diacylglucosamine diphosphatase [Shewanella oneidensis MR-1]|uniref:UDP-2,3-diacylglucosamine hydrolase n=1 Tax=Shewanella oneidensis (strain ATCC 700550 / JCM 31522 / CIP 106686 / LMG 19005 / NCIMB 14063 / MR-1) TaxID=211586 RepID=LPXH_SHEON|nr:UDP-2,3-diacylglucosamine diphosphatase [Shewanella oneidensis]Q8EG24.1 RecName: Full=UDP-2,3-diacylglucosamine hydrolase; AltName: Full=UDP-2,3-diacylglucosamine diphosphatase [Shewanella oneidensis MR-1]AAN54842.1 UDP-23-diacylglucosamine hydrolase LpxH [Shewanella oneidensis MR-1]MDX5996435.1 UDP-2,3-diacylglucosamine diphosphatase [Shewanella oneidensis]MEE2028915.1 UDP-2,3-diacylglucosamine hydrolase [Shewanella oneidensis]QKG96456.1 UDP-2,3-diacylglucosamine diphosphatase [Shewanella 
MRTLFIGDLHLSADRLDITQAFNRFLDTELDDADALYILGDLFEVWVGDDLAAPFALELAHKLKQVSQTLPIFFIHGNRDFMLGKRFAEAAGMQLLPEVTCIELYGVKTVILHGDSLCTLDKAYQRFRKLRSFACARWLYSCLPKKRRQAIANKIRSNSQSSNQQKSYVIMDVEPSAVNALFVKTHTTRMIHGHTHRPAIHIVDNACQRIVVGDWYEQGSVLSVSANGVDLKSLPFETT